MHNRRYNSYSTWWIIFYSIMYSITQLENHIKIFVCVFFLSFYLRFLLHYSWRALRVVIWQISRWLWGRLISGKGGVESWYGRSRFSAFTYTQLTSQKNKKDLEKKTRCLVIGKGGRRPDNKVLENDFGTLVFYDGTPKNFF